MIVTEKEAAKKLCHRGLFTGHDGECCVHCIGSRCMAWTWVGSHGPWLVTQTQRPVREAQNWVECQRPEGRSVAPEGQLWMELPIELRQGCCGLVYPTKD